MIPFKILEDKLYTTRCCSSEHEQVPKDWAGSPRTARTAGAAVHRPVCPGTSD